MRRADDEDMDRLIMGPLGMKGAYTNLPLARQHEFYLSGEIKAPEEYTDWFHTIRNAGENDVVILHINSPGGNMMTAIQFIAAIEESDAQILASVEGECISAATMIFLSANAYAVSEHSLFMFHNYSGVVGGKGGEMYDSVTHERKWSEKFLRSVYKDFLTEAEITSILGNKDIWLDAEDVLERIKAKVAKLQKEMEEAIEKAQADEESKEAKVPKAPASRPRRPKVEAPTEPPAQPAAE